MHFWLGKKGEKNEGARCINAEISRYLENNSMSAT